MLDEIIIIWIFFFIALLCFIFSCYIILYNPYSAEIDKLKRSQNGD